MESYDIKMLTKHCQKIVENHGTLAFRWQSSPDYFSVVLQKGNQDYERPTGPDAELISFIEDHVTKVSAMAGTDYVTGDIVYTPDKNRFTGTEVYYEAYDESTPRQIVLRIPEMVPFDQATLMLEYDRSRGARCSLRALLQNGPYPRPFSIVAEQFESYADMILINLAATLGELGEVFMYFKWSRAEFELQDGFLVKTIEAIDYTGYQPTESPIEIPITNETV